MTHHDKHKTTLNSLKSLLEVILIEIFIIIAQYFHQSCLSSSSICPFWDGGTLSHRKHDSTLSTTNCEVNKIQRNLHVFAVFFIISNNFYLDGD